MPGRPRPNRPKPSPSPAPAPPFPFPPLLPPTLFESAWSIEPTAFPVRSETIGVPAEGSAASITPPSRLWSPRSSRPPPLPGEKVSASVAARKRWCQASASGAMVIRAPLGASCFWGFPPGVPVPPGFGREPVILPRPPPPPAETPRTRPNTQRGVISSSLKTTTQSARFSSGGRASREAAVSSVTVRPSKAVTGSKAASTTRSGAARKSSPSAAPFPEPPPFPAEPMSLNTGTSTGSPEPARARSSAIRSSTASPSCRMAASSGSVRKVVRPCRRICRKPAVMPRVRPMATMASARVNPAPRGPGETAPATPGRFRGMVRTANGGGLRRRR